MLNAATSSATAANAVSPVDRKPRNPLLMSSRFSVASWRPGDGLHAGRQHRPQPGRESGVRYAGGRPDQDLGQLGWAWTRRAGQVLLRGVQRDPGERGRPEAVGRAERGDADDVHPHRLRGQQGGRVAEREVPGLRRAAVDDDLVVGPRGVPRHEPVRVERRVADPVRRLGGRAVAADRLAVAADQLPVAFQDGLGVGHPGHGAHPLEQAGVDAGARAGDPNRSGSRRAPPRRCRRWPG